MLILTRRVNQTLFIGTDIKITVTGISGNSVKIGIEAPEDVVILREELAEEIDYSADYAAPLNE